MLTKKQKKIADEYFQIFGTSNSADGIVDELNRMGVKGNAPVKECCLYLSEKYNMPEAKIIADDPHYNRNSGFWN